MFKNTLLVVSLFLSYTNHLEIWQTQTTFPLLLSVVSYLCFRCTLYCTADIGFAVSWFTAVMLGMGVGGGVRGFGGGRKKAVALKGMTMRPIQAGL
jgi:hypothetical protein